MNPFSSAVNQKLFLARVLFSRCSPAEDKFGHAELALCQGALFELYCAYELYLNEIAANYKVSSSELITTVDELCQLLLDADKSPAEASELSYLLSEQGSWLNDLTRFYQDVRSPQPLYEVADDSQISIMDLSGGKSETRLSYAHIRHFHQSFSEIIERHRELMVEC